MKLTHKTISLLALAATLACASATSNSQEETKTTKDTESITKGNLAMPQTQALEERKQNFAKKADEKTKAIYTEGLSELSESGILEAAKNVGDKAPEFTLKNATGNDVSLTQKLKDGPVVLVWYRGGWCPYCNINLHYLQEESANIKAQGASIIAISPEKPDESMTTAEKNELEFEVLSDLHNKVAKEYGVVFELTEEVAAIYNEKFGLNDHNGDNSNELPLAATYIINTDGTIAYAFLDTDYRNRLEPKKITEFLKSLN